MSFAFVFPGQGSQSVGMQADLPETFASARQTYDEASGILGIDVLDLVANGPPDRLNETANTQPAMLTASVATWRAWRNAGGPDPDLLSGHSLGEYSALVCAGAIEFAAALELVRRRADLMQNAVPAGLGAMAAVLGLDDQVVIDTCAAVAGGDVVEAVNFNAPGQVVIAGEHQAVARAIEALRAAGARRAVHLPVSVPSHSSLMSAAGEQLAEDIDAIRISDFSIPIVCAVTGEPYFDVDDIRERLKLQVYSPVRWVTVIERMVRDGIGLVVECGPGKVLTGLNRRIDRNLETASLVSSASIDELLTGLMQ